MGSEPQKGMEASTHQLPRAFSKCLSFIILLSCFRDLISRIGWFSYQRQCQVSERESDCTVDITKGLWQLSSTPLSYTGVPHQEVSWEMTAALGYALPVEPIKSTEASHLIQSFKRGSQRSTRNTKLGTRKGSLREDCRRILTLPAAINNKNKEPSGEPTWKHQVLAVILSFKFSHRLLAFHFI